MYTNVQASFAQSLGSGIQWMNTRKTYWDIQWIVRSTIWTIGAFYMHQMARWRASQFSWRLNANYRFLFVYITTGYVSKDLSCVKWQLLYLIWRSLCHAFKLMFEVKNAKRACRQWMDFVLVKKNVFGFCLDCRTIFKKTIPMYNYFDQSQQEQTAPWTNQNL